MGSNFAPTLPPYCESSIIKHQPHFCTGTESHTGCYTLLYKYTAVELYCSALF